MLPALALAGCGGKATRQSVAGQGFRFEGPVSWSLSRTATTLALSSGPVDRIEVLRFELEHAYRPALFGRVTRELDGVVARLARQQAGRVVSSTTARLAGSPSRSYQVDYGEGRVEEIAFVLEGTNEYELLCQRLASGSDAACAELYASFTVG